MECVAREGPWALMEGRRCKEVVVPSSLLAKVTQKSLVVEAAGRSVCKHTYMCWAVPRSDLAFLLFLGFGLS